MRHQPNYGSLVIEGKRELLRQMQTNPPIGVETKDCRFDQCVFIATVPGKQCCGVDDTLSCSNYHSKGPLHCKERQDCRSRPEDSSDWPLNRACIML